RRATDGALRSAAPAPGRSRSWSYSSISPPAGWSIAQWPTPLPEPDQLARYRATVETLVR
ncbi:MAG TPA: hypothetical protein VF635_11035, partial [Propionibacteriaceae bacterium]